MSFEFWVFFYIKAKLSMPMIIGKVLENEKRVKFNEEIHCNGCGKQVPGGLQTGESYYQTKLFKIELESFKKSYLCGICRDKKRQEKN